MLSGHTLSSIALVAAGATAATLVVLAVVAYNVRDFKAFNP
jgi:hypothetical protein